MVKLEVGKFYNYCNRKLVFLYKKKGIHFFWDVDKNRKAFLSKIDVKACLEEWQEPETSLNRLIVELRERVDILELGLDAQNEQQAQEPEGTQKKYEIPFPSKSSTEDNECDAIIRNSRPFIDQQHQINDLEKQIYVLRDKIAVPDSGQEPEQTQSKQRQDKAGYQPLWKIPASMLPPNDCQQQIDELKKQIIALEQRLSFYDKPIPRDMDLVKRIEKLEDNFKPSVAANPDACSSKHVVESEGYILASHADAPNADLIFHKITGLNCVNHIYETLEEAESNDRGFYINVHKIKIRCEIEPV